MAQGVIPLLDGVTTTAASGPVHLKRFPAQFHCYLSANSDAAATVIIEGSSEDDPSHWFPILTFVLAGASETAGRSVGCEYYWFRARVSVIAGTGTAVYANANAGF